MENHDRIPTVENYFFETYIRIFDGKNTKETLRSKRYMFGAHIKPVFGGRKIDEITRKEVLSWFTELQTRLSSRTAHGYLSLLRTIFDNACVDLEDVLDSSFRNPAELPRSRRPAKEPSDRHAKRDQVLSHDQARALLSDDRVPIDRQVFYALTIFTGMRSGESAAITWADWDRTMQPLSGLKIARTITRSGVVERTKTRTVKYAPVHKALEEILAVWRQVGWPALFRRQPDSTDFICPRRPSKGPNAGEAVVRNHMVIARGWRDDLDELVIGGDKTPHAMRHSFVSLALRDGASLDVISRVTHPSPRRTIDVYTHVFWEQLCQEVSKLNLGSFIEQPQ